MPSCRLSAPLPDARTSSKPSPKIAAPLERVDRLRIKRPSGMKIRIAKLESASASRRIECVEKTYSEAPTAAEKGSPHVALRNAYAAKAAAIRRPQLTNPATR